MTDVLTLKERGLGVSCINVSCGYYEPHTDNEFVVKSDLLNCLAFIENIIGTVQEPSEHAATPYDNYYSGGGYAYDDTYDQVWDIIEEAMTYDPNITAEDLRYYYKDYFPKLEVADYEAIMQEWKLFNEPIEKDYETNFAR